MPTTIPSWRIGRHLTSVIITGQTVNVTAGTVGQLTDGTAATLTTRLESMGNSLRAGSEEINAVTSTRENMVNTVDGQGLRLEVLEVNDGVDPTPLLTLLQTYDIFKVVWITGSITGGKKTHTGIYSRGDYEDGTRGRGKQICSLTLNPSDAGSASFTTALA